MQSDYKKQLDIDSFLLIEQIFLNFLIFKVKN